VLDFSTARQQRISVLSARYYVYCTHYTERNFTIH